MPKQKIILLKIALVFLLALIFSQCSVYENVTGYFNTYYNARRTFSDAEGELEKNPSRDRDTNYFAAYNIPKSVEDKLDRVIEKCSKLIQFYPKSNWIDDAIMMIGKSYVYKNESESAIRKFNELIENFPGSSLRLEAKMWNAIAHYHSKRQDDALRIVKDLVTEAESSGDNDIAIEALMLQSQIFTEREDLQSAVISLENATQVSGDDKMLSFAEYKLGLCCERLGDKSKAAEAYGKVDKYRPDFSRKFQSKLREGIMLSSSGKYRDALSLFDDLRDQVLKPEEKALVELETANTFNRMNDTAKAFELYDLIDTVYRRTDASAKSYYERGLLFENVYPDYQHALYNYDKAKVEFPGSEITQAAQKKSLYLSAYFKAQQNIVRFDSLLQIRLTNDSLGIQSDTTMSASGESASDTGGEPQEKNVSPDILKKPQEIANLPETESYDQMDDNLEPLPEEQSLQTAKLSHKDSGYQGSMSKSQMPHEGAGLNEKNAVMNDTLGSRSDTLKGGRIMIAKDPLANVSSDSLRKLTVQAEFELAGLFYLEMNLPDSALYYYEGIVDNYPQSKFTPRSYYTMVEIYHDRNDSTMVDSLSMIILDKYSESEYANQIKKSMGMTVIEKQADPADSVYRAGENYLQNNETEKSLEIFSKIPIEYPASVFASKALYTSGWIQESVLKDNDSAASIYKRLIKDYPASIYALEVKPKVAVKDDPKSLDKFIKIKEIPALAKIDNSKKDSAKVSKETEKTPDELDQQPDPQDEDTQDEEDPPEEDDGGGN